MGAKCAPTYANIFLGWWEEVFVYPSLAYQHHVRNWHRYIDDLFFIWSGSREGCTDFIHSLNSNPHNIFLTHSISNSSTSFLDLRIFVQGNKLVTDLFRKPTATNALLEFNSFHPWHTKVGVPTGQFLRIRRNCTRDQDFLMQARDLTDRFRQRSYPKRVVATAFQRARQHDQASLLIPVGRSRESQTRFITDYNDSWGQVRHILTRHWPILQTDMQTTQVISNRPLLTSRRAPNLRQLLTRSHFSRPTVKLNRGIVLKGSFPCGECNVCPFMTPTRDIFTHPTNSSRHALKAYINCRSRNVIYVLICPCNMIYVGQTSQELRKRFQKHVSTIRLAATDQGKGRLRTHPKG
ncbi:uncharacterized protein [Ranitomeya imitator]|uniref:uncharacterized protein isoform X1 n=1 Tax=Ranitomeya imitator TaxID=111125 RepID=UPI0037E72947